MKEEEKQKKIEQRQKEIESRKSLVNIRVVQRNLVYAIGIPPRLAEEVCGVCVCVCVCVCEQVMLTCDSRSQRDKAPSRQAMLTSPVNTMRLCCIFFFGSPS